MFDTNESREQAIDVLQAEVAEVCGVLNAGYGRIVQLVARALAAELWHQWGVLTPAQWVAWQTGVAPGRSQQIVRIAQRAEEIPTAVAALVAGELSLDQCHEIARHVPAGFEAGVTELAKLSTVTQLRRVLPRYDFGEPVRPAPAKDEPTTDDPSTADAAAAGESAAGETAGEAGGEAGGDGGRPSRREPIEERRDLSMTTNDDGTWTIHGHLPADEGAVVERALRVAREDAYTAAVDGLGDHEPRPRVGLVDGLVRLAESALRTGEAAHPGSDRYLVHAHLDLGPNGQDQLGFHLGPRLPDHLQRLRTCDATLRPVWEREGTPVNVGRDQRTVPRKLRRLVEHRHRGCAVPGCERRHGLDIHHIVHWQNGGRTDTANLVALCHTHHRAHHLGRLDITGDADVAGGLTFTDHHGRTLDPTGRPIVPRAGRPLAAAARTADVEPGRYTHPLGERLEAGAVHLAPDAA